MLARNAGLRDAEIRALTWGHVDLKAGFLRVGRAKTEAGEGRTIPFNTDLNEALVQHRLRYEEKFGAIQRVLKFPDESGVTTQMTRQWGRAPKGERVAEATPQCHWKVLTTPGTMSLRGIEAVMTVESAIDGEVFEAYVEQVLCPKLQPATR